LAQYVWPGNVRELENVVERAIIVARGPEVTAADLDFGRRAQQNKPALAAAVPAFRRWQAAAGPACKTQERSEIRRRDRAQPGQHRSMAARQLGINRSTLYYRLRKHVLEHLLPQKPSEGAGSRGGSGELGRRRLMRILVVMDPPAAINPAGEHHPRHGEWRPWPAATRSRSASRANLELDGPDGGGDRDPREHRGARDPRPFELGAVERVPLSSCQAVLMRKDPPFDIDYYTRRPCFSIARADRRSS